MDIKIAMNLAQSQDMNDFNESVNLMERAISQLQDQEDYFHVAWSYRQLGNVYLRHSEFSLAIEKYTLALNKMVTLLGEDHHESLICGAQLCIAEKAQGNQSVKLNEQFELIINNLSNILGENHSMIQSLNSDWDQLVLIRDIHQDSP